MIKISDERSPLLKPQFVLTVNCFLVVSVALTKFDFPAIAILLIGVGFFLAMLHIKEIYYSESSITIRDVFNSEEVVPIKNVIKLVDGRYMRSSYTIEYACKDGSLNKVSFFPRTMGILRFKKHPSFRDFYNEFYINENA